VDAVRYARVRTVKARLLCRGEALKSMNLVLVLPRDGDLASDASDQACPRAE
jgi:hypothetical protein